MKLLISHRVPAFGLLALGVSAALAVQPAAAQTVTKKPVQATPAARTLSTQRLKKLAVELMMYTQDNNAYPAMQNPAAVRKALAPYGKTAEVFLEPGTNKPYLPNPNLSGVRAALVKHPGDVLAFYEAVPAADGSRLICTADGRVLAVPSSKWAQAKRIFHLP